MKKSKLHVKGVLEHWHCKCYTGRDVLLAEATYCLATVGNFSGHGIELDVERKRPCCSFGRFSGIYLMD